MKKITRTSLKRKLDKEISRIVRARGNCAKCRKINNLQTAHIISRSNLAVRWDLKNCLCLCPDCHINFAHKNPILFAEFVQDYLGDYEYEQLKLKARSIKKWTIDELIKLLETLKKIR